MKKVKVIVIRTAGTNCDKETAFAFNKAGAEADLVHINRLSRSETDIERYHIMALPGGFTYGDDIASGKILANELKYKLEDRLRRFIDDGKLVIGICNGFQILVKSGLLPNLSGDFRSIEATLTLNDSDRFEDRWVYLSTPRGRGKVASVSAKTRCVWTRGIDGTITLPVAHGEGKFVPKNSSVLNSLKENGMIVFQYVDQKGSLTGYPGNPNGAVENIAGICDLTGRVFGLMPHPERYIDRLQHPQWTRLGPKRGGRGQGDGLAIFKNGVEYAKKSL